MRLTQQVDLAYPIILGADGRVMDGMHRIARALLDGLPTIRAVQFVVQPDRTTGAAHPVICLIEGCGTKPQVNVQQDSF